jgi:hypothetical protein
MRETCLLCVSKHISQAIILLTEAVLGYPLHLWFAVGHLAEAETECLNEFPILALKIREARSRLMGQSDKRFNSLSLVSLLQEIRNIAGTFNGYSEEERVYKILVAGEKLDEPTNTSPAPAKAI